MLIFLILLLITMLIATIGTSLWIVNHLTNFIYELEEQVEESLDILDRSYLDIGKVLEVPVFYDDPIIKRTLSSIKKSRDAMLLIANKISNSFSMNQKEIEEKNLEENES